MGHDGWLSSSFLLTDSQFVFSKPAPRPPLLDEAVVLLEAPWFNTGVYSVATAAVLMLSLIHI